MPSLRIAFLILGLAWGARADELGAKPINGQAVPFRRQPVQGFSALLANPDGTFLALSDNGFGNLENSADDNLRVYRIRPEFKTKSGGSGSIAVLGWIELHDPGRRVPFAIANHFSERRVLTGADFDLRSFQRAPDGSLWFGDEFGPFLLHTDANGKVLEAPFALPDGVRSPQNPYYEEASAIRILKATRARVFSPSYLLIGDGDPATAVASRLKTASSEIFDVASIQRAGYPVVAWTVNDKPAMRRLIGLGVAGIISDRPDLLREAARESGAARLNAQGHRGARGLRPENTLPAMEAALDYLMTTLETDTGITRDGVPVLDHDPHVEAAKCRKTDGRPYTTELLVKDVTLAALQREFVCDVLLPDQRPVQTNAPALSPVSAAFAREKRLASPYVMPSLRQLFEFARFYERYYAEGPGRAHPEAAARARNAARVRFNVETKLNPAFPDRTASPEAFVRSVAGVIAANRLEARVDVQSFDVRTLLIVHAKHPAIRTALLMGDSEDGTNLQDAGGRGSPWLAGLFWPYRSTMLDTPARAQPSGGFEGMAITPDGKTLLPMLEKPLPGKTLPIYEFDIAARKYTGRRYSYRLEERGESAADFVLFAPGRGLVIERSNTQGFQMVYRVALDGPEVRKEPAVDLVRIVPGDLEALVVLDRNRIAMVHGGAGRADHTGFIVIELARPLF